MKRLIGPGILKALEEGGNVYDMKTFFGADAK